MSKNQSLGNYSFGYDFIDSNQLYFINCGQYGFENPYTFDYIITKISLDSNTIAWSKYITKKTFIYFPNSVTSNENNEISLNYLINKDKYLRDNEMTERSLLINKETGNYQDFIFWE